MRYPQVLNTIGPAPGDVVADYWDDLQQNGSIFYNVEQLTHWGDELWFIAEGYSPVIKTSAVMPGASTTLSPINA